MTMTKRRAAAQLQLQAGPANTFTNMKRHSLPHARAIAREFTDDVENTHEREMRDISEAQCRRADDLIESIT